MPGVGDTDKDSIQQIKSPDVVFTAVTARICSRQFRPSKETMTTEDFHHVGATFESFGKHPHTVASFPDVSGSMRASRLALYAQYTSVMKRMSTQ